MGQLILRSDIADKAEWYFSDAFYSSEARRHIYTWPSTDWQACASIRNTVWQEVRGLRPKIRNWIEKNLEGTVIFDRVDKSYWVNPTNDHRNNSYSISNIWHSFYFSNEASCLLFSLQFSEYLTLMTDHNPDHPEHAAGAK